VAVDAQRRGRTAAAWLGSVLLWLVLSFRLSGSDDGAAHEAGYVVGVLAIPLLVAMAIRGAYVFFRKESPFWSPWVFVIAAVIGFLPRIGDIGDAVQRSEQVDRIAKITPGEESDAVRDCIDGAVSGYDDASPEARAALTRAQWDELIARACRKAERRGLFDRDKLDRKQMESIVVETLDEMQNAQS
jgi:hypothetical protein